MNEKNYLAFDFGQSGVKATVGNYNGYKISLQEVYRFDNNDIYAGGFLQWDILRLYSELLVGY